MNRSAYKGNLLVDADAASTIADEMDKLGELLDEAERLGTFSSGNKSVEEMIKEELSK